ncbi:hypothetical protein D3C81_1477600 [compost metagenome]
MRWFGFTVTAVCGFIAVEASARQFSGQEVPQRQPQVIQNIYVSPDASGSVGNSTRWQRQDGYGGYGVPRSYGNGSSTTVIQSGSGGIRQSIEYPNGAVFPVTPGGRTVIRRQSQP